MHHNVTAPVEVQPGVLQDLTLYTAGLKDIPAVFFYLLISVVMHAIIQEYLLDKVNKKLHLSKVKYGSFNTGLLRLNCLVAVCLLQAWMMWNWIMFQVKRMREAKNTSASSSSAASKTRKTEQEKAKARKLRKEQEGES